MDIDGDRDWIETHEYGKREVMAYSPEDMANHPSATMNVKRRIYERMTFHEWGCPEYHIYVCVDKIKETIPLIEDIIRKGIEGNKSKIAGQETKIAELREKNRYYMVQIEELKRPWYKKLFKKIKIGE